MGDRAWGIPEDQFVAAWNGATSIDDAVRWMKAIVVGAVPKWAVMARAVTLRKGGTEMKPPPATDPAAAGVNIEGLTCEV
jgi:hypothetical protein